MTGFGAIVPFSGLELFGELFLHIEAKFVGDRLRHPPAAPAAQHVANRLEGKSARALEGQHTAKALLEFGLYIDRMERHG